MPYRAFLVKSSTSHTAADFSIKSLASSSGRMDVVIRALLSALKLRNGIRKNVIFFGILEGPPDPPKLIRAHGWEIDYLPESEKKIAEIFIELLKGEKIKGFYLERKDFKKFIIEMMSDRKYSLYYLEKNGVDIRKIFFPRDRNLLFILGDHLGLDLESEKFLKEMNIPVVSLGPRFYFTSHCITIINEELDRLEFVS